MGMAMNTFLLTRPSRDVTGGIFKWNLMYQISTHTPLAGRDLIAAAVMPTSEISTHTPLAGRDKKPRNRFNTFIAISTHTPLAGRDLTADNVKIRQKNFYSHAPRGT